MRLRRNEFCPLHKSVSCCGRDVIHKPRLIRLGVQRIEDPHHPRGLTPTVLEFLAGPLRMSCAQLRGYPAQSG
jgi:hypothetical protein